MKTVNMSLHEKFTFQSSKNNLITDSNNLRPSLYIGVFWDIENIQVPRGKSALDLAQNIRKKFFKNHREAEFICVCDVNNQDKKVIDELALAHVDVVHINATCKNAADLKIKQCMKRFIDNYGAASTLLLISGDVNFSPDLSDFRHRHGAHIIIIHRGHAHKSLLVCAHEHYCLSFITSDLPDRNLAKLPDANMYVLLVTNLPMTDRLDQVPQVLKKLTQNYCGKVLEVSGNKVIICFPTQNAAVAVQNEVNKRYICNKRISATLYRSHGQLVSSSIKENNNQLFSTKRINHESSFRFPRKNGFYKKHTREFSCSKFLYPEFYTSNDDKYLSMLKVSSFKSKNRISNFPKQMANCSKKITLKKCFSHTRPLFGMISSSKLLSSVEEAHNSSDHLKQSMGINTTPNLANKWMFNFSSGHKNYFLDTKTNKNNEDTNHVQNSTNALTNERKLAHQNRIAAQFSVPSEH